MTRSAETPRANKNTPEEPKNGPCNICYRNPHIGQIAALSAIDSVAASCTEAELRVLLNLSIRAISDPEYCCVVSLRNLAKSTGLAVSSVQLAVDGLTRRCLVVMRRGTSTKATAFQVSVLRTNVFASSSGVPMIGTGGVPTVGTPVGGGVPMIGTGGVPMIGTPPPTQDIDSAQSGTLAQNVLFDRLEVSTNREVFDRSRARGITPVENPAQDALFDSSVRLGDAFKDRGEENPIDAVAKANPKQFSRQQMDLAGRWMYGLAMKLSREKDRPPPDDRIVAQFLAISPWPRLHQVLVDIQTDRLEVGYSYGWFLTVALQRIHGIEWSPARQRAAKREAAQLRVVSRPEEPPLAPPEPLVQGGLEFPAPDTDPAEGREFAADLLDKLKRAKSGFK